MLKKIIFAAIVLISFASCKSKAAFNYSQDFVTREQGLIKDIDITESNVKNFLAAEQYDSIAAAGERMEKLVDVQLREIKDKPAPDVKEGDNFKEACVSYFSFIKSMYTGYKDFGNAKTPEARQEQLTKVQEITGHKQAEVDNIRSVQKKYADANGFKLE